jgi:hypothetical protein
MAALLWGLVVASAGMPLVGEWADDWTTAVGTLLFGMVVVF